jgi:hypothetical protein
MYSVARHVYMDDGVVDTSGFAIDKENLKVLRAKIDTVLIDDDKPNKIKKILQSSFVFVSCHRRL